MLTRSGRSGVNRSWKRSGVNVSPVGGSPGESRFNAAQADIRFAEVFDDFSGGFGYAYRTAAPANGIHWSENMETRFPGQAVHCQRLMTASVFDVFDGAPVGGFEWLTDLALTGPTPAVGFGAVYAYGNRQNVIGDTDSWLLYPKSNAFPAAMDEEYASTTTRNGRLGPPAAFGSYFYVGGGTGVFYQIGLDGKVTTAGPSALMGFVNSGNRLWGKIRARGTSSTGNPLANAVTSLAAGADAAILANWSATIPVGNGAQNIADMESLGGQVFLGLPDGIYAGDQTGTFSNVTGGVASNADNFRDMCIHNGTVVGQHIGGIIAYDPANTVGSRVRQIGPVPRSNRSPVQGFATAVESFGGWLYAAQFNGSQSYLMAGRESPAGGWQWHVQQRIPAPGRVSRIHVDNVTAGSGSPYVGLPNRLWVAMGGSHSQMIQVGTAPLYFSPVPGQDNNPLGAQPYFSANYMGSATMVLPRADHGAPGVAKIFEYVDIWADGFLSGSRYADVYYTTDTSPTLGAVTWYVGRAQQSPVSRLYINAGSYSTYSGRSIEVQLNSFNSTPGTCQVYRSVVVYGVMRPQTADIIDAVVHIGDNVPDRRGVPMRPGRAQIDELRSFADPNRLGGQVLTLIDLAGATQQVVVVPPIGESEYYQDGARDPEIAATVRMAVLTLSGS